MSKNKKKSKEKQSMGFNSQNTVNRKAAQKKKKTIIISAIAAVLVIALIVTVVVLANRNNRLETTRITTYNIDEVTYGNVSTTISGSGSLSPITKATLTLADCIEIDSDDETDDGSGAATQSVSAADGGMSGLPSLDDNTPAITGIITDVSVEVGDTVDEGEVIAVVTFDDESTANIVAPYDAVLLEFYLHENDEVSMTSSVAMFMGTDGYSMTVSVDETNISAIKLGQEVDIKIDAVSTDEEIVGAVSDISYNGSASGSVTAYKITVTFDYVEGTYPGMSVSAEIVIEDSGDGLLVPVDAVYTSGDTKYVYLAPSGSSLGDEYDEDDLDTSKLTKVTVETGMSDGTYMVVSSSKLEEGTLIVITKITSTLTGSSNEGNSGTGGFGGGMGSFPGGFGGSGSFPDFGGMGSFPGFN